MRFAVKNPPLATDASFWFERSQQRDGWQLPGFCQVKSLPLFDCEQIFYLKLRFTLSRSRPSARESAPFATRIYEARVWPQGERRYQMSRATHLVFPICTLLLLMSDG